MKVTIVLEDRTGDPEIFTSLDWIRGTIHLQLQKADAVSKITLSLQGKLLSSVVAAATNPLDGILHAVDSHKLFKLSLVLFPHQDVPIPSKGFSLPKGATVLPFQIRFPILSTCQQSQTWTRHLKTTLPPSFKFKSVKKDGYAQVEYYLRVKVLRPGLFKSNLAVKQEIDFIPLDPGLPPPMMEPTRCKCVRSLKFEIANSNATSSPRSSTQWLDSRLVTLEANLPSPAVLRTRSTLPLSLFMSAKPGSSDETPPLILRSLSLAIQTETTVHVGPNLTTWTTTTELFTNCEFEIKVNDENKLQEVSKDVWKDIVVPVMSPSFTTCTLMQEHFVVISAGFSYGMDGVIQMSKLVMNVEIHSGVERHIDVGQTAALDGEQDEEETAFIPWRSGSESHLGILGRTSSRPLNTPPPPY